MFSVFSVLPPSKSGWGGGGEGWGDDDMHLNCSHSGFQARLSDAPGYYRERFGGVYAALMKQGKRG